MSRYVYVITAENVIHSVEQYGRSPNYYARCGQVIARGARVQTINFDDVVHDWICPTCVTYGESAGESAGEDTKHNRDARSNMNCTNNRITNQLPWLQKGYDFVKVEVVYGDAIERDTVFDRRLQRTASRRHRYKNPYVY